MSRLHALQTITIVCALAFTAACAFAQTDAEHAQHHPESSASKPMPKASKPMAPSSATKEAMSGMDSSMKAMQDMHEKMMTAKTPEERNALMAEHKKVMQDGMAMMGKMNGMASMAGMGEKSMTMMGHHQMMEKRMDMMTTMMQMMMDQMPEPATK